MEVYDLVIIGAGPAGLSAAINGASELRHVLLVDSGRKADSQTYRRQLGGQAIGSTLIENYAGFPKGISGCDLMARFEEQASLLGTHIVCPEHAGSIGLREDGIKLVTTREGSEFAAKSVVLANGLSYKKHDAQGVADLLGKGVLYGAPTSNPHQLGACTVCVVGGANSAGQAVMHLSQNPECKIRILIRGKKSIESQMSQYLADRIRKCRNVEVVEDVSVFAAIGSSKLEAIELLRGDGSHETVRTDHLFIFIGAAPKTEWLKGRIVMDSRNFVATGNDLGTLHGLKLPYETSIPGVFAAGDVRFGSVKRVAAAVGEGSAAVSVLHQYLARQRK